MKTKSQFIWFAVILLLALISGCHFERVAEADDVGHFQAREFIWGFAIGLAGALIYFLPSLIAGNRAHRNLVPIIILDTLLGWTILGWIGALIWAVIQTQPPGVVQSGRDVA